MKSTIEIKTIYLASGILVEVYVTRDSGETFCLANELLTHEEYQRRASIFKETNPPPGEGIINITNI